MTAPSKVLWALDNEISPRDFERLCVDLLGREGYSRIAPIGGTKDHGRDAEAVYWSGRSAARAVTAFQFSLQEDWERKLRTDAAKIAVHSPDTTALVFVSSRAVTGEKQDKLAKEFRATFGWSLAIHGREWLRMRLEEVFPDLARKYLHLDLPDTVSSVARKIDIFALGGLSEKELFSDMSPDLVRATIVDATRREPAVADHWMRLARIDFIMENFRGALPSITRGLELKPDDINLRQLKGVILAEIGLAEESRPLLVQAKEIFVLLAEKLGRPLDHYNLANILEPLGDVDAAEMHYLKCLAAEPGNEKAWKNLGTLYSRKGQNEKAMECFDKALALNPALVEAHLSKANTWLVFLNEPGKAIESFRTAYGLDSGLDVRWRHGRYWFSRACLKAGQRVAALEQAELGLRIKPDDGHLLALKAEILSGLWPRDRNYQEQAYRFFAFRTECFRNDCGSLAELVKIGLLRGNHEASWQFIEKNLDRGDYSIRGLAGTAGLTLADFLSGFESAGSYRQFRRQHAIEDHGARLQDAGLTPDPALIPALEQMLRAPFGVAARHMEARTMTGEVDDMPEIFAGLVDGVSRVFAAFGAAWLARERPAEKTERTRLWLLGTVVVFEAAVAEAARMAAFLAEKYGIPPEVLRDPKADWSDLRAETGLRLLEQVTAVWDKPE